MSDQNILPSDECFEREAYLVSRGVRPVAQLGCCSSHYTALNIIWQHLAKISSCLPEAIPFVVDHGDGSASYGYAKSAWAADLYRWAVTDAPKEQKDRILGLVLGYSTSAIQAFEERKLCGIAGDPPRLQSEQNPKSSLLLSPSDRSQSNGLSPLLEV